ncbi:MAG: hypothetical protein JKX68_06765 [Flavobacteriales bacterium]|nr:hypothetical protein [Flavobacteriales bacterium]
MKNLQIKAIVMVFVIIMPLVLSTIHVLNDDTRFYECCENTSNEEQSEERDSEEDVETLEGFIHEDKPYLVVDYSFFKTRIIKDSNVLNSYKDILTPPPKNC